MLHFIIYFDLGCLAALRVDLNLLTTNFQGLEMASGLKERKSPVTKTSRFSTANSLLQISCNSTLIFKSDISDSKLFKKLSWLFKLDRILKSLRWALKYSLLKMMSKERVEPDSMSSWTLIDFVNHAAII